jgi:HlyD family secretion protein
MRIFITILVVAALGVGGYFAYQYYQQQQEAAAAGNIQTVAAGRGGLTATVGATGTVRANQTANLAWQITGTVEKVPYDVGQKVKNGDILAALEQTSWPQSLIAAAADLIAAQKGRSDLDGQADQARVKALQDIQTFEGTRRDAQYQLDNFTTPSNQIGLSAAQGLDKMRIALDAARKAFEPYKYAPSGDKDRQDRRDALDTAQADYDSSVKRLQLETRLEVAKSNLKRALSDYEKYKDGPAKEDVQVADARILAARTTLKLAQLTAPFDATITDVKIKPGDQAAPGLVGVRLDDLSHLLVDVQVSEIDVNRIREGQEAVLKFDAIPGKEYKGTVSHVAEVGLINQGVVNFIITVELTDPDQNVKSGMTGAVNLVVTQLSDVLKVPNRAVRLQNGKRVVYLLKNGKPTPINITLGATSDTESEVKEGDLKVGDPIVLNPPTVFQQNGPPPFARGGGQ